MGWGKRIKGIAEAAGGAALTFLTPGGQGAGTKLMAQGGADIAGSYGDKKAAGQVFPGQTRTIGTGPQPPAASLEDSRGQNKTRMKSIYNYP